MSRSATAATVARQQIPNMIGGSDVSNRHPLLASYERYLRAARLRPATIAHYLTASRSFCDFAAANGMPPVERARRENIEAWLLGFGERGASPYTIRNRLIGLRQWLRWLVEEGELRTDPSTRIRLPALDEVDKDVATPEEMTAALTALEKARDFRGVAIIALFYDTGVRVGEVCEASRESIDWDRGTLRLPGVTTKARFGRTVALSPTCVRYLDRYVRRRRDDSPALFVGTRGPLTRVGVYQIVRKAFEFTGRRIGPHDLRHTSASHAAGKLSETHMMQLYGWRDADMARHYTRQVAAENAIAAHRLASPLEALSRSPRASRS